MNDQKNSMGNVDEDDDMLKKAIELRDEVLAGAVNEKSRTLANILKTWLDATKVQVDAIKIQGGRRDVRTVEKIEKVYREIDQRFQTN